MSNKDLFKKFVKVANPGAQVTYNEERAKARPVRLRPSSDDPKRARFDMLNRTQGIILEEESYAEPPPKVSQLSMMTNLVKKYARVANPEEAAKLDEGVRKSGSTGVSESWSASRPLPIDELKAVLKAFVEPLKEGLGGAYTIRTEPYETGYRATVEHKVLNEDAEIQTIVAITCQLNGHGHPSKAEMKVALFESVAKFQTTSRSYDWAEDLVNDFSDFASAVTRLL